MLRIQYRNNVAALSRSFLCYGLMAVASWAAIGCSASGPAPADPKKVVPVSGTVHVNGEPQAGVKVRLVPIPFPADGRVTLVTIGRTDAEGKFKLTTYYQDDGAPVGDFGLTFEFDKNPSGSTKDFFKGKYSDRRNPQQKLTVKGDEESIELPLINLEG